MKDFNECKKQLDWYLDEIEKTATKNTIDQSDSWWHILRLCAAIRGDVLGEDITKSECSTEDTMIHFLLHKADDSQVEEFFGYNPHGFSKEDIEDVLSQMPEDVLSQLAEAFGLAKSSVEN